ncbi:MAG: transcriptional regulator, TetR family [Amycolatopsis sp.]|jgi:AcrR family transcriptional regulator|uniref:TetR/AcrR family transcriptional regulator n=1 Tax=Amycolatopsis sp. TaxID=37632 RepID=UPI002623358D|nr:TetR/AcrR family transcriptional regulator [Amycolatopsis sp.]MCU1683258.1 transcriptional regulator, TetR family [Amycolatopsis sp.]
MTERPRRAATGAAVLQPEITTTIVDAVIDELAGQGYGKLSMEAVARRAGVGKSALYRRWPSKQHMVIAAISAISVPLAEMPDTGSLRGDLDIALRGVLAWLSDPKFFRIMPDLIAETARNPDLAAATAHAIGEPRRARGEIMLRRAIERGELAADLDLELAMDLLAAPIHWRLIARHAELEPGYLDKLAELLMRAFGAR